MPIPAALFDDARIERRSFPDEDLGTHLSLLVANGRCGGSFDPWGLQHTTDHDRARRSSRTHLTHAEVFHHGKHGIDGVVALGRLAFDTCPGTPETWSQSYDVASGCLTTDWAGQGWSYTLRVAADPAQRDRVVLAWNWRLAPGTILPAITLIGTSATTDYSGTLEPTIISHAVGNVGRFAVAVGTARGHIAVGVAGALDLTADAAGLRIAPRHAQGSGRIALAMGPQVRAEALAQLAHSTAQEADPFAAIAAAWAVRHGDAWIEVGDPGIQRQWLRWLHQILATYAPDVRCPMPPMGASGNAWGYHFPQDLSYIHPALLRLGHHDILRAHIAFYASRLAQQEEQTRRIYGQDGIMWAWEFPIGDHRDLLRDGEAPNSFQYEIHNAAYPARMAYETACVSDDAWSQDHAWPVVEAAARFYASAVRQGADGRWGIHLTPSMGQDEYGGADAPDYLCAFFSIEYTLTAALALAERLSLAHPQAARWRTILADGLGYERLREPQGFFRSNARVAFAAGAQKHPVQLNPLTFLPLGRLDAATRTAWRQRRILVSVQRASMAHGGMQGSFYDGWTLPAFCLAAARMGDAEGLAREWQDLAISQNIDREAITVHESCGFWQPYYTTSMGLLLQALHEALVSDWTGTVTHAPAWPRSWGRGAYHGFHFLDGTVRSSRV